MKNVVIKLVVASFVVWVGKEVNAIDERQEK